MDKEIIFILIIVGIIGTIGLALNPVESAIPPTPAISMINTTSGNVTATNYNSFVEFVEGYGISIAPDYSLNTITFTATGGGGPKIFNQTAQNDFQIIGINNVTGVITTNQFSVNSVDCGTEYVQEINNVTGAIICAGGGGGESNTMSSPTHANTLVLAKSGVDLPIKGIACGTNTSCSANATDITISATGGGISDGDKGDITVTASGATWTIDNNVVSYAKMQDVSATSRFLGRITAGAGDTEELTGTQATTLLDAFTSALKGLVPASGGGTSNFLRADGTWAAPTASGGAVSLGADVVCTSVSPSYCTVFTIPLTASSGNAIEIKLVADSNTAGAAVQPRVIFDNAGNTGYCTFRTYTTATAEVLDVLAITTTTADTGETVWLAGANVPMPIDIRCGLEGDATPGNAVVQIQQEVASTGTVQKGSFYIKTP